MKRSHIARAAAIIGAVLVGQAAQADADPVKVRIGWQTPPEKILPILTGRRDLAPHFGTSYDVELMRFGASTAEITALATNDLDVASLGYSSFGLAIENAHLDDLKIVTDGVRDGVPGYYSTDFAVLKDSGIKTVEDLKGKVLAASGPGSGSDMAIRQMMRMHHMEDKRDYVLIPGIPLNQFPMLAEHKADLVTMSNPQRNDPKVQAVTRTLFVARDALGTAQWALYAARAGFLEKNRAQLYDFFEDLVRVTRWQLGPAHRDEIIKILSAFTKQPPEFYASYLYTTNDNYRDPDCRPDLDALQNNLKVMKELGFLKTDVDARSHVDLSFVDEAVRRLK